MSIDEITKRYRSLEATILEKHPEADITRIREAFEFARKAHSDCKRKDGTEFITHPLAAAELVMEFGLDEDSICAALLHDTIEDTGATYDEIKKLFGKDVAEIVDGVTKLTRVQTASEEDEQMENLRKMLTAMQRDMRVILIKIADRLHNMRTMEYVESDKQRLKAFETMEIYTPIVHRLGMYKIKWELEDLSIRCLDPVGCKEIEDGLKLRRVADESFIERVQVRIAEGLKEWGLECTISGRVKNLYSIYRKKFSQNIDVSKIYDLYAIRVIVNTKSDCYSAMGHIHELYKPVPGTLKDYINSPKANKYRSIHTIVMSSEGIQFEVQIRTWSMHQTAEYGIAAHWKYKKDQDGNFSDSKNYAWVKRLLESQQDSDPQDFLHDLKVDMLFSDEIFVFTPNGDIVNLPSGSTPIDFAYSIHSEVGNKMTGALVNGRMVSYSHVLEGGDIVRILTSNSAKGPSRDWLNIIKSPEARNKIRQWFKREKRDENIVHGKQALEGELRHANISPGDAMQDSVLQKLLSPTAFQTIEDLYAAIGYGGVSSQKIVNRIRDILRTFAREQAKESESFIVEPKASAKVKPVQGVIVEGLDNCLIKFARCCNPVPGDAIVGFITRGHGVSVHRQDCTNYLQQEKLPESAGRWVKSSWGDTENRTYETAINISTISKSGLVVEVATVFNSMNIAMNSFNAKELGNNLAFISVVIKVKSRDELISAMARVMSIRGVTEVKRI